MAMSAMTTAADDFEKSLLAQGAISASMDCPEFDFLINSAAIR
jgi:hypothetical protein